MRVSWEFEPVPFPPGLCPGGDEDPSCGAGESDAPGWGSGADGGRLVRLSPASSSQDQCMQRCPAMSSECWGEGQAGDKVTAPCPSLPRGGQPRAPRWVSQWRWDGDGVSGCGSSPGVPRCSRPWEPRSLPPPVSALRLN